MLHVRDDHDGGSEAVPRTAWLSYCYTHYMSTFLINLASRGRIDRSILWGKDSVLYAGLKCVPIESDAGTSRCAST
jgi:hypothetical protein